MCGIVGIIKEEGHPVTSDEHKDFLLMLEDAQQRGNQATGVIYVYENGSVFCMKSPSSSCLAIDYIPHRKGVKALLGHTRQSTGGSPQDNKNNHPHETKNWALIHNGTCWTNEDLKLQTLCDTEEFAVMFESIREKNKTNSTQFVLRTALEKMNGSWSLAFVNKVTKEIYLTTNGNSPLSCIYFPNGMFFASLTKYFKSTKRYITDAVFGTIETNSTCTSDKIDSPFEPEALSVFRINSKARMEFVTEYIKTARTRNYGSTHMGFDSNRFHGHGFNDDDYELGNYGIDYNRERNIRYPRSTTYTGKIASDYFTKKEFDAAVADTLMSVSQIKTEIDLFEHYEQQLDMLQVDFNIKNEEFEDNLLASQDVLRKIAIHQLIKNPTISGLNYGQVTNLKEYYLKGHWLDLPTYMDATINKTFNTKFISELATFLDSKAYVEVPQYVWNMMEDETKMSSAILKETSWEFKVLSIYFGIFFDDISLRTDSVKDKTDLIITKFKQEPEETFPESKLACVTCAVKCIMKSGSSGSIHHVCPNCGHIIIEVPTFTKRV